VEGLVVVDMNLGVKVVVGDSGYGRSCIGGSSRLRRHVWGGRNENGFPKDRTGKSCFYVQEMKRKEKKIKKKIPILLSPLLCPDVLISIQSSPIHH
jgi:hypothetical protein